MKAVQTKRALALSDIVFARRSAASTNTIFIYLLYASTNYSVYSASYRPYLLE